jgi:uncharacterized protein with GYD domain
MHFVLLASHNADVCPTSNSKTRDLLLKGAPEMPNIAKRVGVNLVAGPFVNAEHVVVVVVEAERADAVYQFVFDTNIANWNKVRVLPSLTLEEGLKQINESTPIF